MRTGLLLGLVVAALFVLAACDSASESASPSVESPASGTSVAPELSATAEPLAATESASPSATATQTTVAPTSQARAETTSADQPAQTPATTITGQASSDQASGGQVSVEPASDAQLSTDTTVAGQLSGTIAVTSDAVPTPTQTVDDPTPAVTVPPATDPPATAPPAPPAPALVVGTNVGELAPDFQLPAASGSDRSLASYRGDKNVLVVFYRAFF